MPSTYTPMFRWPVDFIDGPRPARSSFRRLPHPVLAAVFVVIGTALAGLILPLLLMHGAAPLHRCDTPIVETITSNNLVDTIAVRHADGVDYRDVRADIVSFNHLTDQDLLTMQTGDRVEVPCR